MPVPPEILISIVNNGETLESVKSITKFIDKLLEYEDDYVASLGDLENLRLKVSNLTKDDF